MPRRPRAPTTTAAASAPAGNVLQFRVPDRAPRPAKVKSLLALVRTATENMDEIRSSLGGTTADAVETHGLHKKAFGWIKQLDKMSPEKINDLMQHFAYYYEASGLKARAESAPRLPEATEGEREALPPPARGATVTPFPNQPAAGTA